MNILITTDNNPLMFQRRREEEVMDTQKKEILEAAGYNFDSELLYFVNRIAGKFFRLPGLTRKV